MNRSKGKEKARPKSADFTEAETNALVSIVYDLFKESGESELITGRVNWDAVTDKMNGVFKQKRTTDDIRSRFGTLKGQFNLFKELRGRSKWTWDAVHSKIVAPNDEAWKALIESNRVKWRPLKNGKRFPWYDAFALMMGSSVVSGECTLPPKPYPFSPLSSREANMAGLLGAKSAETETTMKTEILEPAMLFPPQPIRDGLESNGQVGPTISQFQSAVPDSGCENLDLPPSPPPLPMISGSPEPDALDVLSFKTGPPLKKSRVMVQSEVDTGTFVSGTAETGPPPGFATIDSKRSKKNSNLGHSFSKMAASEYIPSFDSFLLPLGLDHEGLQNVLQNKKPEIEFKTHERVLQFSPHMEGVLVDMGLHTVAVMDPPPLDRALIFALAERFRPETNTFHLPVGEMTITPKDVNVLLGMKITGLPVTGVAIKNWREGLPAFLGLQDCVGAFRQRTSRIKGRVDTDTVINLRWLTTKFNVPLDDEDYDVSRILYYTRAYILELFGCILFPNKTRDRVHAFLIQFLEDWEIAASYNWGGAVLAYLYRSLAELAHRNTKVMTGCAWLLQLWSWSYIAIRRPSVTREYKDWLHPDCQRSHAYAMHWTEGRLIYPPLCIDLRDEDSPRFGLEYMTESHIDWEPYMAIIPYMPDIVQHMHPYWEISGPVIFMWACTYCYCDRVFRQFGRGFYIPRPPHPWPVHNRLNKLTSSSGTRDVDWRTKYPECLVQYEDNNLSDGLRGRGTDRYGYFQWYIPTCFSSILGRTLLLPRRSFIDHGA